MATPVTVPPVAPISAVSMWAVPTSLNGTPHLYRPPPLGATPPLPPCHLWYRCHRYQRYPPLRLALALPPYPRRIVAASLPRRSLPPRLQKPCSSCLSARTASRLLWPHCANTKGIVSCL